MLRRAATQLPRSSLRALRRLFSDIAEQTTCVPVVIVGAGPTGLVLSSLLSQYGVKHMVLEKAAQLTQHPQAHYINNRTMEIFRGIPGLSQQVCQLSPPLDEWQRFIYCESLVSGQLLGEVDHFPGRSSPCDAAVSPEPVAHLSQHHLSQLLLQEAQRLAARAGSCIQLSTHVNAVSLVSFPHQQQHLQQAKAAAHTQQYQQDPEAALQQQLQQSQLDAAAQAYPVCVAISRGAPQQGHQQQELIRCSYLVAADGSHSTVRQLLNIQLGGRPAMQHLISIHFTWPQLGAALLQAGRGGMLYFVFNAQLVAVLVAHNLGRGEFVAQVPYFPPLQSPALFTPELCTQLIHAAAGFSQQQQQQPGGVSTHISTIADAAAAAGSQGRAAPTGGLVLHTIKSWVMSAEVAEDYGAWANRVLLAGDAVHRFPPAGGFGMNTGIQDAHNLAWKLAAVIHGTAHPALLSTYQPERQPVAQANAALSISNWQEAIRIPQALGLDPAAASLVNRVVSSAPLPTPVASWLLDASLALGRSVAQAVVPLRRAALQEILASGLSLRLQFPKEDLGFVYTRGAVDVRQAGAAVQQQQQQQQLGQSWQAVGGAIGRPGGRAAAQRDNVYVPTIVVGGRLPHAWLQLLHHDGVRQASTLDLCAADLLGLNMLLLCSPTSSSSSSSGPSAGRSSSWAAAGQKLSALGWPIKTLQLLPQGTDLTAHKAVAAAAAADNDGKMPVATGRALHGMAKAAPDSNAWLMHSTGDASSRGSVVEAQGAEQQLLTAVDIEGTWAGLSGEGGAEAVLLRPDGHIAWLAPTDSSASGVAAAVAHSRGGVGGDSAGRGGSMVDEDCGMPAGSAEALCGVLVQVLKDVLHLRPPQETQA